MNKEGRRKEGRKGMESRNGRKLYIRFLIQRKEKIMDFLFYFFLYIISLMVCIPASPIRNSIKPTATATGIEKNEKRLRCPYSTVGETVTWTPRESSWNTGLNSPMVFIFSNIKTINSPFKVGCTFAH